MKNLPFFLLTFFLFGSVITNAIGYYLILFLYTLIYVIKYQVKIPKYVKHIGYILLVIYISFIISNFLNFFFQNPNMSSDFYTQNFVVWKLLKSRMPTSYLTTGLFLLLISYLSNKNSYGHTTTLQSKEQYPFTPLESFFKGALWGGVFFSVFFLFEYISRFGYRDMIKFDFFVSPQFQFHAFKRPEGFLANSLTLASMSLAYFCFFYTYFCSCYFGEKSSKFLPFSDNKKTLVLYTLIPAVLFFFILILTVAKLAVFLGFCLLIAMPLFFVSKKNVFKIFSFIIVSMVIGYFICNKSGYTERILYSLHEYTNQGHIDNRTYFREVYTRMFLDKPWIGNGFYWLSHGIRDKYFVLLGYADLNERNYPAHNFYLEILASGGIFCASFLFYGIIKIFATFKRLVMHYSYANNSLWVAFFLSIFVNLFHGLTQNNFLEASTTYVYFYLFFVIFLDNLKISHKTFR